MTIQHHNDTKYHSECRRREGGRDWGWISIVPDDRVGEVGVGAHPGSQCERQVCKHAHDEAADQGGGGRGDDEVLAHRGEAAGVARVDGGEFASLGRGHQRQPRRNAVAGVDAGVAAQGDAVGDAAGAAGVRQDARVHRQDVGHGEERGGARAELLGEVRVALLELEVLQETTLEQEMVQSL